jgi:hypothetical protein
MAMILYQGGSNGGGYTYSSLNEIKVRSKDEHVGLVS